MKFFPLAKRIVLLLALMSLGSELVLATEETNAPLPVTARDFYNAGTSALDQTNFTRAELMFQSALAAQDEQVQPAALYNVGDTRFALGLDYLKKGPDAQKVADQGKAALTLGDHALQFADAAMATNDMGGLVEAYLEGRGARHQLRDAEKAVAAAMEIFGNTLRKWQRADADFKSAAELDPANTNALHNAETVERAIAQLVDITQKMQALAAALAGKRSDLGKMMSKMRGQMPGFNAPPGPAGSGDDDDEDITPGSLVGQKENAGREGQLQVPISPDQAAQIINGLQIDGSKRLPMGGTQEGKPAERNGRTW